MEYIIFSTKIWKEFYEEDTEKQTKTFCRDVIRIIVMNARFNVFIILNMR